MRILLIETCTERGIIAYGSPQELLVAKELPLGLNQSKFLMPSLVECLQPFGFPPSLDVIGVGKGPGSYTGIRIGVAVAQALAYSWKVPLVGVSSLEGFVPFEPLVHFAALIDARIGGVYCQKGWSHVEGLVMQESAQVLSLDEVGKYLEGITHLVTPVAKSLQAKMQLHYPDRAWRWEERFPSIPVLLKNVEQNYLQGKSVVPPRHLDLLYLRETEAEREKAKQKHFLL